MPVDVEMTKRKVEAYLANLVPSVTVDDSGAYSARSGSARVFVKVVPHPDGESTMVYVFAQLVEGATLSPELYEYVATDASTVFGTLLVIKDDQGTGSIYLRQSLLGDFLDSAELEYAVGGIASSADDIDDELAARFGGSVFHPEAD